MNAAAAAAVDFKNGFGTQFNGLMQPFTDTDSLYSTAYTSYNNWATKVSHDFRSSYISFFYTRVVRPPSLPAKPSGPRETNGETENVLELRGSRIPSSSSSIEYNNRFHVLHVLRFHHVNVYVEL